MRENRTSGSVRGVLGDRRSYRERRLKISEHNEVKTEGSKHEKEKFCRFRDFFIPFRVE